MRLSCFPLLALFPALLSCGGSGTSVSGVILSTVSGFNVPAEPAIGLEGDLATDLKVEIDEESAGTTSVTFKASGLAKGGSYIFRLSDPDLDTTISFPFTTGGVDTLTLAAVRGGTIAYLGEQARANALITAYDPSLAAVMGQVNPTGEGTCRGVAKVQLVDAATGGAATAADPIYFDNDGNFVTTAVADRECTYLVLNVPSGNYRLRFLTNDLAAVAEREIRAVGGKTTFGLAIP